MKKSLYTNLKVLFIALICFFANSSYAQMAIVQSTDGYSNLRSAGSTNAKIISPLQNNIVVLVDELYAEEHPNDKWLKVYVGSDPYCLNCSSDLSKHKTGFIHESQLRFIKDLKKAASSDIKMSYTISPFKATGKQIKYADNEKTVIASINGKSYFGADCGIPKTEIQKVEATVKGKKFNVPLDYIWSIINAQNNFKYFQNGNNFFAIQSLGDGACYSEVVWVFDAKGLKQRMLGWSY